MLGRDRMIFAGRNCGESIARRRRCVDKLLYSRSASAFKYTDGALDVGIHVIGRALDRGDDVADACEMKDEIDVVEKRIITIKPADIAALEGKPGIFGVMREIRLAAT